MGKIVKNGVDYTGGSGVSSYNELNDKPQINGVTLSGNKTPDALGLVTKAVNDLVNYYLKTETYSKTEVDTIVSNIKNSRFEVVATLPTSDIKTNVIYLVPKADAESGDIKDEYINLDGTTAGWEKIGSTEVDLSGYATLDDLNTALADYTTTTDLTALLANKQDKLQYSTLPTASAELEGKIYQFTGVTNATYTHNYWYECVSDGASTPTYSWQQTNVQPSGGSGGTTDYSDLENKPSINNVELSGNKTSSDLGLASKGDMDKAYKSDDTAFTDIADGDYVPVYDTSATTKKKSLWSNVKAKLKTYFDSIYQGIDDKMTTSDMDEIFSTLPSKQKSGHNYSTAEQVIGTWIDGSTLYEKTINFGALPNATNKKVAHGITNLKNVVEIKAIGVQGLSSIPLPDVSLDTSVSEPLTKFIRIVVSSDGFITIFTGIDRSSLTAYVTLRYTKI